MPPLVSAILPVRNRAEWIARAVDSVLAQTCPDVELIVVDDGSEDETPAILDRYGERLVRRRSPSAGAYAARNLGIATARGELIAFIDSDDAWRPQHLAQLLPRWDRATVGLVFADTRHVTGTPTALVPTGRTSFRVTPPRRGRVAPHFLWGNFVPTTTTVVRRRVLAEAGPFAVDPPLGADYAKWIQIAQRHELDYVDAVGAEYTVHAEGISSDLGRSLAARMAHVGSLATAPSLASREGRTFVRRLLFHLALHLAVAWVRRRASNVPHAPGLAWSTARDAGARALPWALAFAYHHSLRRARRLRRIG